MKTLEHLLAEVQSRDLRINNLFQLSDGRWRCNVRRDWDQFWEFGEGDTPNEAVVAALRVAGVRIEAQTKRRAPAKPAAPALDMDDLIG